MKNLTLRKITFTAILTTLALISFMLENLLPPIIFPGARIGISNIFILIMLISCGDLYAVFGLIIKIVLGSLFSGNISACLYSLPAGTIALLVEMLLIRFSSKFSIISISVVGAILNSIVQNTMFCLITKTSEYFVYLPYLALISTLGGLVVGFAVYFIIKLLPKSIFDKLDNNK